MATAPMSESRDPRPQLLKDLEMPPELAAAVEQCCRNCRRCSAADRLRVEEDLKLQYFYGGLDVLCRHTPAGRMVLAAGTPEEVGQEVDRLGPEERRGIVVLFPSPWDGIEVPTVWIDET